MVDATTYGTASTKQSYSDDEPDLELHLESESSTRAKQVVLASVLASLSIAAAPIAEAVPRIPGWGIAVFDPVSIFWIVAFLLGGIWVGMVSVVAGTIGLFLYDPTGIGPIFKLIATLPMLLAPWLGVRRLKNATGGETSFNSSQNIQNQRSTIHNVPERRERSFPSETQLAGGESLSIPRVYIKFMFLGIILRLVLMVPLNLAYGVIAYPFLTTEFIVNYALILNLFQSFWDIVIPFIIVHPTGMFRTFKMW
jgi:hypothetical protein